MPANRQLLVLLLHFSCLERGNLWGHKGFSKKTDAIDIIKYTKYILLFVRDITIHAGRTASSFYTKMEQLLNSFGWF